MAKAWLIISYWLPVALWMVIIFSASGDQQSAQMSSRFLEPFFRWLFPDISQASLGQLVFLGRKLAHVCEYAILSMLCWRGFKGSKPDLTWRQAGFALLVVTVYAITDEGHQTLVPNRQGTIIDVLIDCFGGLLGLTAIWLVAWIAGKRVK